MKDTLRTAVVAAFAVLSVAFAAATLDSAVVSEEAGPNGPRGGGAESGGAPSRPGFDVATGQQVELPLFVEVLALLALVALLVVLVYETRRRNALEAVRVRVRLVLSRAIRRRRDTLKTTLVSVVLVGLLVALSLLLLSQGDLPATRAGSGGLSGGGSGNAGDVETAPSPPILLLLVGLALAGVALAFLRGRTDDDGEVRTVTGTSSESAAAVGRTAGRAADRLEGEADADNEIYRAWREMTEWLDVPHPEASTPGEFADAAVEAGLGREDVRELTRLFEDVRYGDVPPSDEHERRALAVFRRIEDRYAEGEP